MSTSDPINVGFIINPIAGMGGKVGLKGTDGVTDEARALGAIPSAGTRARVMLREFLRICALTPNTNRTSWITASGELGEDALEDAGITNYAVVYQSPATTSRLDTARAVRQMIDAKSAIIVFCGGDGTARDICALTKSSVPIIGVPCGVKMYSGVFGTTASQTAKILYRFIQGELSLAMADVLDLDETEFRNDRWTVRLYHSALTPVEPTLRQEAKAVIIAQDDEQIKTAIADHLAELIERDPDTLYLLGPGSTMRHIANRMGFAKTLLGIDAIAGNRLVAADTNEKQILSLLKRYPRHAVVLSPIGAQGFVLGRGNLPLSAAVIENIGIDNVIVAATPAKLSSIQFLRFDTGDSALDRRLRATGFRAVICGYHRHRMVPTQPMTETGNGDAFD